MVWYFRMTAALYIRHILEKNKNKIQKQNKQTKKPTTSKQKTGKWIRKICPEGYMSVSIYNTQIHYVDSVILKMCSSSGHPVLKRKNQP